MNIMKEHFNIAFTGLGSIAKRHLKNVVDYLINKYGEGSYTIDLYRSSLERPIPEEMRSCISNVYLFSGQLPSSADYDIVFVTNPTLMHYETLRKFKQRTKAFFIEKPIFGDTGIDASIFEELRGTDCYVACPLRYHPVLQYVRENIPLRDVHSVRTISSSYLPDWRPGQDYRRCYSAHREMGGGADIDLIHEWDYLTTFFGMPQECHSIRNKISDLEIDSDDVAIYIARAGDTVIELHLDYFGRYGIRTLELYMPEDTIICDLLAGTITYLKQKREIRLDVDRNEYQLQEISHFFDIINHESENDNTMEHAFEVLRLAKGEC